MTTKSATKKKATTKKTAAAKPAAKTKAPSARKTPARKKAAAKKSAPTKKTPAKKAAKPAAKTSPKAAPKASLKTAAKKAAPGKKKATAKSTVKKTTEATSATKKTVSKKTPAEDKKTSTKAAKKATTKKAAVKKSPKSSAKDQSSDDKSSKKVERKKLNVGQKPRSGKSEAITKPSSFAAALRDASPVESSTAKPSAESKEAKQAFKLNDKIVYPAHGVGQIVAVEKQEIAGVSNELFLIVFEQEKMRLRVPTSKAASVGMRPLSDPKMVDKAVETLKGRARIKRTMWSRRAQEYEAKINSGSIISVAEVVRDLYRAADQPEQSYSERQLFEAALDRLAREVAAVRGRDLADALGELDGALQQKKAAA